MTRETVCQFGQLLSSSVDLNLAFEALFGYSLTTLADRVPLKPVRDSRFGLGPGTITLLYLVSSAIWISLTDLIVNSIQSSRLRLFFSTTKGLVFVLFTGLCLYLLISKLVDRMRQAQQSLAASEEEYRGVVEAANEGVCRLTSEDGIGLLNPRMAALLGRGSEELIGMPLSDFVIESDAAAFGEQLHRWHGGATEQHDFRFRGPQGNEIKAIVTGTPIGPENSYTGCLLMVMDVTERLRIQEQLQQAQKLEAVGRFAGGIAHDFNNALGIVIAYATLLKSRVINDTVGKEYADAILLSCERSAALVKQLLAFSREQPLALTVVDLNDSVSRFGKILPRVIGDDVRITLRPDARPVTAQTDPVQIERILMNLAVNARDALPEGGELLIETGIIQGSAIRGIEGVPPGEYSYLRFTDSGIGMDAETQSRIFEPFFTTKGVGKGTGLGLSTVYGIVKQSNGFIGVISQPKKGTAFTIYFPVAGAAQQVAPSLEQVHSPRHGSETILLVEDEEALRTVTTFILTQRGYRVIEAKDGREALEIFKDRLPEIDLVVTDLVMPHMGGRELACQLAELKPSLKIAFVSGYVDESECGGDLSDCITIEKPISPDKLVRKIRQILDGGKSRMSA